MYYINAIDLRVPVFTFTNGSGGAVNPGTSCMPAHSSRTTRLATVFNSQADVMATLGSDGVAHATYSPDSIYMHETFAGRIASGDTPAAAQRPVTYNWAGGGTGPLAELDAGRWNTVESETLPETCSDYSADTLCVHQHGYGLDRWHSYGALWPEAFQVRLWHWRQYDRRSAVYLAVHL